MGTLERIDTALQRRWSGILAQTTAIALAWGALVLTWSALGLSAAWQEVPAPARVLDVLLIGFNLLVAVGLWRLRAWGVVALYTGALLLQFLPYVVLRGLFVADPRIGVTINTLLVFEVLLLGLLALAIARGR